MSASTFGRLSEHRLSAVVRSVAVTRRPVAVTAVLAMLLTALTMMAAPAQAVVAVVNGGPPTGSTSIIVFPQRDFVSATGYDLNDRVVVRVIHSAALGGGIVSTGEDAAHWIAPNQNPGAAAPLNGIVEVNHPGGFCWFQTTPDIRPGDVVQIEVMANAADATRVGRIDETTVANVTNGRPIQLDASTVVVHGTAQDAAGAPLPIASIEQRLVAPGQQFANGRRTLRAVNAAGADGLLTYDGPNATTWTATYSGLSAADVTTALGAESRSLWLGNAVAPALESTIYEKGALTVPGPAAPCTAPLEVLPPPPGAELVPPSTPANLAGTFDGVNTVHLTWDAATDNVGVTSYGVYRNGVAIFTVQNADGSAPAPTSFTEANLPPGTYTFEVRAFDEVGNASGLSNAAGPFVAVQRVDITTFPINDPPSLPINIIVFPSRDFISPSGFQDTDTVSVQVLRRNPSGSLVVVSSADGIIPIAGFAEVNHPGGACWAGVTPDIRAGDVVRTIAYNLTNVTPANVDGIRSIDQTTVSGVTASLPQTVVPANDAQQVTGTVQVHGTALGNDGKPIPVGQLEQRMIATHGVGLWDLNGRRALRAASAAADGVLSYDPVGPGNTMGVNWTATYTGLDEADVARFADADTRAHWLGRDPLTLAEATIFENAPGANPPGPAGPGCTRPLETLDTLAPTMPGGFSAVQDGASSVTLTWTASTDNWSVAGYRIYVDDAPVANVTGATLTYTVTGVKPGPHAYAVRAYDTASPLGAGATPADQIAAGLGNLYGNLSAAAGPVPLTQADVTAPEVPRDLVAVSGIARVDLSWTASTDDVGLTAYGVYRDDTLIATVPGNQTIYADLGLALGTYTYTIDAVDAAANRSAKSAPVTADVTEVPDIVAPTVPTGVVATTSPDVHGRDIRITWTASTDNTAVAGYRVYRDGVKIATLNGTTLTYLDATRPAGTYGYQVDAIDSANNASTKSATSTAVVANDPPVAPHSLIAFPARDFISATGYTPGSSYVFSVLRGNAVVNVSQPLAADATGLIEVNHPGGTCWTVNTPDIRTGDVVRITDTVTGVADQTTVADVTAERPYAVDATTIEVRGTAADANGLPLPAAQVESRLITGTANAFDVNGRRVLRAGGAGTDGTLVYDPAPSTHWTARFTGLSPNDVLRAVGGTSPTGTVFTGAESRAMWLGRDPIALTESTIFENGPGVVGGPSAPCTAPAEPNRPAASLSATSLAFPGTQFVPAPAQTSAAQTVTLSNGGAATLHITNIYLAGANRGDFFRANDAQGAGSCPTAFPATLAAGASCTIRVMFRPTALGLRQANVSVTDDAANTTDQTVLLTGQGVDNTDPTISLNPTNLAFGTVNGGVVGSRTVTVTNTSNDPTGRSLTITAASITGTNAGDFTISANSCLNQALVPANPANGTPAGTCNLTVQFRPGARAARSATLTLTHNRALPSNGTTTSVPLTGTGGNGAVITFGSNPVNFGTVTRGATKDQTISVKNGGNAAATGVVVTVTGAGYTRLSTTCGTTIAINGSCNVVVRFVAPNTVGTFTGTLSVAATNGIPPTATTALTATTK